MKVSHVSRKPPSGAEVLVREFIRTPAFDRTWNKLLDLLCHYFRVDLQGLEHVPRRGGGIIIANHSGVPAIDALVLAHLIHAHTGRRPRIMAHRAYFEWFRWLRSASFRLGLREPHVSSALRTLIHGRLLIVFPEGEAGNFKSSLKRYRLQPFHTGFVQLATRGRVPVIPCLIVGAEESNLNLGSISLGKFAGGLRLPLPLNLVPLPAKWSIRFLPPIPPEKLGQRREAASRVRRVMQEELRKQLRNRPYVYLPRKRKKRVFGRKSPGSTKRSQWSTGRRRLG